MPLLDKAGLEALQAKPVLTCAACGRAVRPNYCRECDEYYEAGHLCPDLNLHDAHRSY